MQRISRSGSSLVEVIISTAVFSLVVISVFAVYSEGQYQWKESITNNSLQFTVRKAMIQMEQDFQLTDYNSVNWISNSALVAGVTYPRTAVCMGGVDDWQNPSNFSASNLSPVWDVYIMYIATTETNIDEQMLGGFSYPTSGRFYRIEIFPTTGIGSPPGEWSDCADLASDIWANQAQGISGVTEAANSYEEASYANYPRVTYIGTVDAFSINTLGNYVEVTFRSKEKANASEAGSRGASDYEGLQVDFVAQPQNTP